MLYRYLSYVLLTVISKLYKTALLRLYTYYRYICPFFNVPLYFLSHSSFHSNSSSSLCFCLTHTHDSLYRLLNRIYIPNVAEKDGPILNLTPTQFSFFKTMQSHARSYTITIIIFGTLRQFHVTDNLLTLEKFLFCHNCHPSQTRMVLKEYRWKILSG